jgi:hypothetical protein
VYWQNQMRCYVENGGGGCCYRKEKMKKTKWCMSVDQLSYLIPVMFIQSISNFRFLYGMEQLFIYLYFLYLY